MSILQRSAIPTELASASGQSAKFAADCARDFKNSSRELMRKRVWSATVLPPRMHSMMSCASQSSACR